MQIYYNTIDYTAYASIKSLWFLTSSLQVLISFTSLPLLHPTSFLAITHLFSVSVSLQLCYFWAQKEITVYKYAESKSKQDYR